MDYTSDSVLKDESGKRFSDDELSVFKRFIEENVACPANAFEFTEENLSYYAGRHTSDSYVSLAECYHANSDCARSDEMDRNIGLYSRAIEWHAATVHPIDSEYVVKREKYVYSVELPPDIAAMIGELNGYPREDYFTMDLLIVRGGDVYQYLARKDFVFKRKSVPFSLSSLKARFVAPDEGVEIDFDDGEWSLIVPIFVPIRKMLFVGEFGYRSAMLEYGRVTERLATHVRTTGDTCVLADMFDVREVRRVFGLDGVERSVLSLLFWRRHRQEGGV